MKNIVVVDDQPVMANIYRAKFIAEGFNVDVACDGEQALEVIKRTKPDLVLLDLMLPKVKGIDVLKRLRATPSFKNLPIVVFSNCSQPGAVEEAWTAGATVVLSKSNTSPKQMVESVHTALAVTESPVAVVPEFKSVVAESNDLSSSGKSTGRILFVEINPETRAMISHLLVKAGHQVINAEGTAHAILLGEATHFDLVLINRALWTGSLAEFCQQIRRRNPNHGVIVYSMNATRIAAEEGLRNGVSRYLTAPEELLDVAQISSTLVAQNHKSV